MLGLQPLQKTAHRRRWLRELKGKEKCLKEGLGKSHWKNVLGRRPQALGVWEQTERAAWLGPRKASKLACLRGKLPREAEHLRASSPVPASAPVVRSQPSRPCLPAPLPLPAASARENRRRAEAGNEAAARDGEVAWGAVENEAGAAAAAGTAARPVRQPGGQGVSVSTLRMPPGGRLQSHLQGYPPHSHLAALD